MDSAFILTKICHLNFYFFFVTLPNDIEIVSLSIFLSQKSFLFYIFYTKSF